MMDEAGFEYDDAVSGVVWYRHCHPIHASMHPKMATELTRKRRKTMKSRFRYTTMKEKRISKKRDKICTGFLSINKGQRMGSSRVSL